ncbi:cyclin-domain-containing protein [Phascolomyces articulosus]|uniref:Cyclin-domain-containing protein n=1 Tax=Phascolomyces articulosus TaxID=60185 RepID=A0AAD5KEP2_9FUNG|nr:cyclin-domain-containing protein [Phascolomyces articulosus]
MSPCQPAVPPSLLSCTKSSELADFCAFVVPCIWAGSFKQQPQLTAKRYTTFKMFCHKVLKATQISCACVVLSLYYIHRLRSAYPSIRASIGSEVRLFTTALILANKFLDDNTFTNKTWSDVSSIPVRELNIMEMEFLSALNYNIYIHHQQFFAWVTQCQHWVSLMTEQHHRPIKMPARLSIKSLSSSTTSIYPTCLSTSTSLPTILPSSSSSSSSNTTTPSTLTPPTSLLSSGVPTPTSATCSIPPPLTTSSNTTCLKRRSQMMEQQQPASKRRYYHVPYTPPDESISPSYPQTPLYTPPDLRLSLCTSTPPHVSTINTPTTTTSTSSTISSTSSSSTSNNNNNNHSNNNSLCRPILSWSSSSSALASSRHHTSTTTPISYAFSTASLASRVRCLEIE